MESKHIKFVVLLLLAVIILILVGMAIYNVMRVNNNKSLMAKAKSDYLKKHPTTPDDGSS